MKKEKVRDILNYKAYVDENTAGIMACVLQLFLIYLAVSATVLCFSTSLAMPTGTLWILLICLLFTVLFAAATFNKITFGVFAGVAALAAAALHGPLAAFIGRTADGFKFCYDLGFVIMKMRGYNYTSHMLTSEDNVTKILQDETLANSYFTAVLITLAVFFALWYVILSWKFPRAWPTVIISIGILAPGFFIGLAPSPVAFALLLSTAFGIYTQTLSSRKVFRRGFKARWKSLFSKQENRVRFFYSAKSGLYGISVAGISTLVMLLIALVTYHTPLIKLDQVREYLDSGSRYVYNRLFYSNLETADSAIGSMLDGDIVHVLRLPKIHDVPVMKVTSKYNETTYLRAWTTTELSEDGWKVLTEEDDKEYKKSLPEGTDPYDFAYRLHQMFVDERLESDQQKSYGFVLDDLTVKARFEKSLVVHRPSYGIGDKIDGNYKGIETTAGENKIFTDSRPKGNAYRVETFTPIITTKGFVTAMFSLKDKYETLISGDVSDVESERFQKFYKEERAYSDWAAKKFTDDFGISFAMESKAHELADGHKSQLTKVLSIERYFRDNSYFTYTIKPEQVENATVAEQIDHSLFVNQEGYCSYFATAMTLMVRTLGYPARYVSGYIVRRDEKAPEAKEYSRTVMDNNSHAWVEVYFTGLGWLAFDPTPDETETSEMFSARYYALDIEAMPGDDGGVSVPQQDLLHTNYVEEQPEDNEIMPTLSRKIWSGTVVQIALWALFALLVIVALPVVALVRVRRRIRRRYLSAYEKAQTDLTETVNRMNERMIRWLELKRMIVLPGESQEAYFARVDEALALEHKLSAILPLLRETAFSGHTATNADLEQVTGCYEEVFRKLHHGRTRIPLLRMFRE